MTRPAEGVAAERMAEVGVGRPAVTSGAAFVKNMSAPRLWKVSKVDSPETRVRLSILPPQPCSAVVLFNKLKRQSARSGSPFPGHFECLLKDE
jgi:hypothetical protein